MVSRSTRPRTRALGVIAIATTVSMFTVLGPVADAAAGSSCRITDLTTQQIYDGTGSNLQTAIDAAAPGTRLRVRGVCVGNFEIDKNLELFGRSTVAFPTPTLDGNHAGRVLTVFEGSVVLKDLTITNGLATADTEGGDPVGGGIFNDGTLTLKGASSVTHNRARSAGGIFNRGALTLMGSSSVSGNKAKSAGGVVNIGGIFVGVLTLNGSSSVTENSASGQTSTGGTVGNVGGISNESGTLVMNDRSSVSGNSALGKSLTGGALGFAGGIFNNTGTFTMNDSSSVSANFAGDGGGVSNLGTFTMNDSSSVSENTSDGNGGGISNGDTVTMNGGSSVRRNTAINGNGGGIFNFGTLVGAVAGGNVSDNVPDDIFP